MRQPLASIGAVLVKRDDGYRERLRPSERNSGTLESHLATYYRSDSVQSDSAIESVELYFLSPAVQFSTTVIAGKSGVSSTNVQEEPLPVLGNVVLSPEAGNQRRAAEQAGTEEWNRRVDFERGRR